MGKNIKILAIETSCDETSAAVVENGDVILSNVISSQIDLHKKYSGVVPEIASRAHIENIIPVIEESLSKSKSKWDDIDAIAVTKGPGLLGSLLVGVNTAKTLAFLKEKPLIAVNHIEGHIYANFIRKNQKSRLDQFGQAKTKNQKDIVRAQSRTPKFPLITLIVSGGHTNIVYMKEHLHYKIIGKTIDDAAGEAFDKVSKLMNLGYPGGPIISNLADAGNLDMYNLPRTDLTPPPARDSKGYLRQPNPSFNFSFSGLKTAVLTETRKNPSILREKKLKADLAASFQQAVIDILVRNCANAVKMYKPKSFLLSGGVAANRELRKQLEGRIRELDPKKSFYVPDFILCTDNAAMLGAAAYYRFKLKDFTEPRKLSVNPNLKLC